MAIVVFEHHVMETSARLGQTLRDHGYPLRVVRTYAGDPVPADLDDVDGVVSMGGPMNIDQQDRHAWLQGEADFIKAAHEAGLPVVGVCFGAQLIAQALGGKVQAMDRPEVGWHPVKQFKPGFQDTVFDGIPWTTDQLHTHGQEVTELPPGATLIASSDACKHQAFRVGLTTYAFQYHFEWTRSDIHGVLEQFGQWIADAGQNVEAIRAETDEKYEMYRHMGDRLCERLATLLFCIEHRLSHTKGPAANFDASQS